MTPATLIQEKQDLTERIIDFNFDNALIDLTTSGLYSDVVKKADELTNSGFLEKLSFNNINKNG